MRYSAGWKRIDTTWRAITPRRSVRKPGRPWPRPTRRRSHPTAKTAGRAGCANWCARSSRRIARSSSSSTARPRTASRWPSFAARFTASSVIKMRTSRRMNAARRNFSPAERSCSRPAARTASSTWRKWRRPFARQRDLHSPKPRVLSVTQATELGTVYTRAELAAVAEFARARSLYLHMDGARFANAVAALDCAPKSITWELGVDVLCLGGTKNGAGGGELVVFFNKELAARVRLSRETGGAVGVEDAIPGRALGGPSAGWRLVAQCPPGQRRGGEAGRGSRRRAGLAARFPARGQRGFPSACRRSWSERLHARGWHFYKFLEPDVYRLMCSWAASDAMIEQFVADLRDASERGVNDRNRQSGRARIFLAEPREYRLDADMRSPARLLVLTSVFLAGCGTARDVAVTSFRVIDAPAHFIRRKIEPGTTTTTTTTTVQTGPGATSDVVTPGRPVAAPTPPPRIVERSRSTAEPRPNATPRSPLHRLDEQADRTPAADATTVRLEHRPVRRQNRSRENRASCIALIRRVASWT